MMNDEAGSEIISKILAFLSDRIWPLIALVALFLFRQPLGVILTKLMKLKVEAGKFKLETYMQTYLPQSVITKIAKNPHTLALGGERRWITILYSDIKGFTTIAERLDPEMVTQQINLYLTAMTRIVFNLAGTLESYRGLSLTAYWGAPLAHADSADRACDAALQMISSVSELNPLLIEQGMPPLRLSIAVTTGEAIIGNLGSEQRFNYSIIGDTLDILPRLASMTAQFQVDIVLTGYTRAELSGKFQTRLLSDKLMVRGKDRPIELYELINKG
jgi:adenylate cyclase